MKLRGAEQPPHHPDAVDNNTLVPFVHEIVGLNDRGTEGIGRARADESSALRPQLIESGLEDGKAFQGVVRIIPNGKIQLNIRRGERIRRIGKTDDEGRSTEEYRG